MKSGPRSAIMLAGKQHCKAGGYLMTALKAGSRVRVIERELSTEDAKSGLYYSYFGGLTGTVDRSYDDDSVCVDVEIESLTEEMRVRHLSVQEAERKRWLENLSDELRNRLSAEQKQLKMNYRILVSKKDLEPAKGDRPSGKAAPTAAKADAASSEGSKKGAGDSPAPPEKRLSEADLAAAEEEHLRARQSQA